MQRIPCCGSVRKGRQLRIDLGNPTCSHTIRGFLRIAIEEFRADRIGNVATAAGDGVDWTIPRRLLRSPRTKKLRHAYRAVWQGQVLHNGNGGAAICKCGAPRTLQHVMCECPRSKKYRLSQAAESFRRRFPPFRLRSAKLRRQAFFWKASQMCPAL